MVRLRPNRLRPTRITCSQDSQTFRTDTKHSAGRLKDTPPGGSVEHIRRPNDDQSVNACKKIVQCGFMVIRSHGAKSPAYNARASGWLESPAHLSLPDPSLPPPDIALSHHCEYTTVCGGGPAAACESDLRVQRTGITVRQSTSGQQVNCS